MQKIAPLVFFIGLIVGYLIPTPEVVHARRPKQVRQRIVLSVTPTTTPTLVPSPLPTHTPTPLPTPTPAVLSAVATNANDDEIKQYIIDAINDYRRSLGLGIVASDEKTCAFAQTRASEIAQNFTHDGFRNRVDAKTLPYPSYSKVTENIAMTPDYKRVVVLWRESTSHAENMRADTPFVCVEQSANYYAYEGWKP